MRVAHLDAQGNEWAEVTQGLAKLLSSKQSFWMKLEGKMSPVPSK